MAKTTTPNDSSDSKSKPSKATPSPIAENTTLSLNIPWLEVQPVLLSVIKKASKKLRVDGFRKGHVPPKIAQEYLSSDFLVEETTRQLMPNYLPKLIRDSGIEPISQPEIQIKSANQNQDWQFNVILAAKPQIDVKDYQKIVKKARLKGQKQWQESQKAIGEEKKKKASNKKDQATADLNSDQQSTTNDQTDHAHHDHDHDHDSPEKKAQQEQNFILQTIYTQLVIELKPQIPELLVRQQAREELETLVKRLQDIKLTLDDYLKQTKQSFEDLSSQLTSRVLGQLQLAFILQDIAKQANIEITEADIDHEIDTLTDAKDLVANRANPRMRAYLRDSLLQNKIIDHLLSIK